MNLLGKGRCVTVVIDEEKHVDEQVCRDPKVDMRLSQLVAQSKAKAEKERVPLVARNPSTPQKDPENQQLTAPSVEWKQSIQCHQCQVRPYHTVFVVLEGFPKVRSGMS